MINSRNTSVSIATIFSCMTSVAVWAQGIPAQKAQPGMDQKKAPQMMQQPQQQMTLPGQCTTPDKVAVTDLTLNPKEPKQGQAVVVTLTIKNLCNVPLANIAWQIASTPDNTILGSGTWQASVAPGQSITVTAPWRAVAGQRGFDGRVDPAGSLREGANERANNVKTASISVAQMSASTQGTGTPGPSLVTQNLDYNKALNAGARFAHNLAPGTMNCLTAGQRVPTSPQYAVVFVLNCIGPGSATPEAFTGFKLKNGWKVKRVADVVLGSSVGGWQWELRPSEGSDSPAMKMRLDPGSHGSPTIDVSVQVIIEGPEGTDPYVERS